MTFNNCDTIEGVVGNGVVELLTQVMEFISVVSVGEYPANSRRYPGGHPYLPGVTPVLGYIAVAPADPAIKATSRTAAINIKSGLPMIDTTYRIA